MRAIASLLLVLASMTLTTSLSWADVGGVNTMGEYSSPVTTTQTTVITNVMMPASATQKNPMSYITLPSSTTATFTSPTIMQITAPSTTVLVNPVCLGTSCVPAH